MIITYATSINIILMFHYFIFITIRSITKIENAPNSEENVTIRYSNKTVGMTEAISGDVTVLQAVRKEIYMSKGNRLVSLNQNQFQYWLLFFLPVSFFFRINTRIMIIIINVINNLN